MINLLDYKIDESLKNVFGKNISKEVVMFCVGNHKIWYDSFGPLVAEKLRYLGVSFYVYGGVDNTIVPDNLIEFMDFVETKHAGAIIVVIDNCLATNKDEHLMLEIKQTGSTPAFFVNEKMFGNYSILLKVDTTAEPYEFLEKQNIIINTLASKLQIHVEKLQKNAKKELYFTDNELKYYQI